MTWCKEYLHTFGPALPREGVTAESHGLHGAPVPAARPGTGCSSGLPVPLFSSWFPGCGLGAARRAPPAPCPALLSPACHLLCIGQPRSCPFFQAGPLALSASVCPVGAEPGPSCRQMSFRLLIAPPSSHRQGPPRGANIVVLELFCGL